MKWKDVKEGKLIRMIAWDVSSNKKIITKVLIISEKHRIKEKGKIKEWYDAAIFDGNEYIQKIKFTRSDMRASHKIINDHKLSIKLFKNYISECI